MLPVVTIMVEHPRVRAAAADILADGKSHFALEVLIGIRFKQIPQRHRGYDLVGHFDADGGLAGDRSFDPDIGSCQIEFDIICQ